MATIVDPQDTQSIMADLNGLALLFQNFYFLINQKPSTDVAPVDLKTEEASLFWSAALAETLANNASSFRNGLKFNDEIDEQLIWPDPGPMSGDDIDDLVETIAMTAKMERGNYEVMLSFYPLKQTQAAKPSATLHDVLNTLVKNQNEFIEAENQKEYIDYPISYLDPPALPTDEQVAASTPVTSLHRIQFALHRLLQAHMQVASFVPVHLREARNRALAAKDRAVTPRKFHPKKKKPIPIPPTDGN